MLKYKVQKDPCPQSKPTKHNPVLTLSSNKSLIKFNTGNQNKSTTSVQNQINPINNKSLNQKNKSSKHLQSHTFATNTHQNSINVGITTNSHNNSKSNKKVSNNAKKSNGKKVIKHNQSAKLITQPAHIRSASQYQNLSFVVKEKPDLSKNYKNVLKARKQQKDRDLLGNKQPVCPTSKSRKNLKNLQFNKKSINISSFKQLKTQQSKSRSKSKQFQKISKKSNPSKKYLQTDISHTISKENNMNHANSKSFTKRNQKQHMAKVVSKKKDNLGSDVFKQPSLFSFMPNNNKVNKKRQIQIEEYEQVPLHVFKSSTNSDIEYSNIDENTVKSIIRQKKMSNQPYFYHGQDNDIIFYKDEDESDVQGQELFVNPKKQKESDNLVNQSKRYSRMNLQLSSDCFNCLTQPDYMVQPKGIRHLNTAFTNNQQPMKSNQKQSPLSKVTPSQSRRQLNTNFNAKRSRITQELLRDSAIKIQKVWRGYMTRKYLAMYIEEEEMKLEQRMRQFGDARKQYFEDIPSKRGYQSVRQPYFFDNSLSYQQVQQRQVSNQLDQSSIPQRSPPRQIIPNQIHINNSLNTLDYESQILPRQEQQTISFIGEINNIGLRGISLIEIDSEDQEVIQQHNEVMYTSVESIERLSNKGDNIFERQQIIKVDIQVNNSYQDGNEDQFGQKLEKEAQYLSHRHQMQNNQEDYYQQNQEDYYQQIEQDKDQSYQLENPTLLNKLTPTQQLTTSLAQQQQQASQSYHQSSYQDPTTIFIAPKPYKKPNSINNLSQSNANHKSYMIDESQSSYMIDESSFDLGDSKVHKVDDSLYNRNKHEQSSYRLGDQSELENHNKAEEHQKGQQRDYFQDDQQYNEDSLQLPQQPSVIIQNSLKQYKAQKQNYAVENNSQEQSNINSSSWQPSHQRTHNISKSYCQQPSNDVHPVQRSYNFDSKMQPSFDEQEQHDESSFDCQKQHKLQQSYQIQEQQLAAQDTHIRPQSVKPKLELLVQNQQEEKNQAYPQLQAQNELINEINMKDNKLTYSNKSNPNILIVKSPKHQHYSKQYFTQHNNQINQQQEQSYPNKQSLQKTSSLKQIFMKKSFFFNNNNNNQLHNQQADLPIPSFPSHQLNLLSYPTQKQATSIQSLLHFRHQCLTNQHSSEFKHIQQQYVKQNISKQQFIDKLQSVASKFQSQAVSIKQTQKDIFNGYKALLKLIKDVVKDCKVLGFNQQKGSNVRFCRSMEVFLSDKLKTRNECVFDDQYLWRFDDVMIDQLDKSKNRSVREKFTSQDKNVNVYEQKVSNDEVIVEKEVNTMVEKSQKQHLQQRQQSKASASKSNQILNQLTLSNIDRPLTSQQKQLSRQSSSHHHLPQLFIQPRQPSPDKPLSISRKSFVFSNNDVKQTEVIQQPQRDTNPTDNKDNGLCQPCSFDISELEECEDQYVDQEDSYEGEQEQDKTQLRNVNPTQLNKDNAQQDFLNKDNAQQDFLNKDNAQQDFDQQPFHESSSYNIDDEQPFGTSSNAMSFEDKSFQQQQNSIEKKQNIQLAKQQQVKLTSIPQVSNNNVTQISRQAQHYITQFQSRPTLSPKILNNLHSIINTKNKQLSQPNYQDHDLLQQQQQDNQPQPVIKRQVYQLSCDSDSQQQENNNQFIQQQMKEIDFMSKSKKLVVSEQFYRRAESFDLFDRQQEHTNCLSSKYHQITQFIAQVIVWEFIEQIIISKARHISARNNMGKRLSQFAKLNYSITFHNNNQSSDSDKAFPLNDQNQINSNVVIITNSNKTKHKRQKQKHHKKYSSPSEKQLMGRITQQQIESFLVLLYKQLPVYVQSRFKLSQRMYPNPLQLLKSLRDTEMENYFTQNQQGGYQERQYQANFLKMKEQREQQNHKSSSVSASSEHVDSQTSYLQLGSYQFLLSQQLCQTIIQKYIAQVYEPSAQLKHKHNSQQSSNQLTSIKKEFNQYISIMNILKQSKIINNNNSKNSNSNQTHSPKSPKSNDFQTIIRTRQLFCQHKQLQSQMLRKEILKIQLHTILDSMNQELIKQRQSKTGYSGIGLNQLALGLVERTGIDITNQEEYNILVNKAKYRLQKFVLNEQVNANDKLLLQCQQTVTINDSQWVFYVTQALQFGLQISKIVEQVLWEQSVRQISRMMLKRTFQLDNDWETHKSTKSKSKQIKQTTQHVGKQLFKSRKVVSINIVVPQQASNDYMEQQQQSELTQKKELYSLPHEQVKTNEECLDQQHIQPEDIHVQLQQQQSMGKQEQLKTVRTLVCNNKTNIQSSNSSIANQSAPHNPNTNQSSNSTYPFNLQAQQLSYRQTQRSHQNKTQQYQIKQQSFDVSNHSYDDSKSQQQPQQKTTNDYQHNAINNSEQYTFNKEQSDDGSYQLDDEQMDFDEDLQKQLQNMNDEDEEFN